MKASKSRHVRRLTEAAAQRGVAHACGNESPPEVAAAVDAFLHTYGGTASVLKIVLDGTSASGAPFLLDLLDEYTEEDARREIADWTPAGLQHDGADGTQAYIDGTQAHLYAATLEAFRKRNRALRLHLAEATHCLVVVFIYRSAATTTYGVCVWDQKSKSRLC